MWAAQAKSDFSKPWFFISTPTLHNKEPGIAPEDHEIMEVASYCEFEPFEEAKQRSYKQYEAMKNTIADRLLELVEKRYIPNLQKYIDVKVVGTPTTNEDWAWAPKGNAYGATMTPEQLNARVSMKTQLNNFYFCNASAGYAGMNGTTGNGIALYELVTGERFFDPKLIRSDEERAELSYQAAKQAAEQPASQIEQRLLSTER